MKKKKTFFPAYTHTGRQKKVNEREKLKNWNDEEGTKEP